MSELPNSDRLVPSYTALIDAHRDQFGVEPICHVLEVAPSTYCAAKSRPTSARQLRDEELKVEIARVHEENIGGHVATADGR